MAQNVRQQRQDLARRLRAEGHTWRDIADAVRKHWPELTARQAMRHARGASYHGGLQLLADPTGRTMTGAWVGFGRSFEVNTGTWELAWISPLPEGAGVAEATVPAGQ